MDYAEKNKYALPTIVMMRVSDYIKNQGFSLGFALCLCQLGGAFINPQRLRAAHCGPSLGFGVEGKDLFVDQLHHIESMASTMINS